MGLSERHIVGLKVIISYVWFSFCLTVDTSLCSAYDTPLRYPEYPLHSQIVVVFLAN